MFLQSSYYLIYLQLVLPKDSLTTEVHTIYNRNYITVTNQMEYIFYVLNMQDCIKSKLCANNISQIQFCSRQTLSILHINNLKKNSENILNSNAWFFMV